MARGVSLGTVVALVAIVLLSVAAGAVAGGQSLAETVPALDPVLDALAQLDASTVLTAGAVLVGILGGLVAIVRRAGGASVDDDDGADPRPEEVTVDPATVAGADVDRLLDAATAVDRAEEARTGLAATAAAVVRASRDLDPEAADRRVETGAWTDDALVAGFLGPEAPVPVVARLRGWLDPAAERQRRIDRSVAAIRTALAGEVRDE